MTREQFRKEILDNLNKNILPYWINRMVDPAGGFYGRRDGCDRLVVDSAKGAILNARILWTFSAAYLATGREIYKDMAGRAFEYIRDHFIDKEFGGVYWALDSDGKVLDDKKQFYAIGFTIYGMSEYARATGSEEAAKIAYELFETIERYSRDPENGGYWEAMTRNWKPIGDMRLSDKDDNASKTMNTHLHILEPYTNLLRVYPKDEKVRNAVVELVHLFLDRIEDKHSGHLGLFFNDNWTRRDHEISYGHDIEASWLLLEAALETNDRELIKKTLKHTRRIAYAALEGRCYDGSMVYERHASGHYDNDKHWWVQAENVIGQVYLWRYHGVEEALDMAIQSWEYIKNNIVDKENGEWIWSRKGFDKNLTDDKAGFWKCPYHNSRMCLEVSRILG